MALKRWMAFLPWVGAGLLAFLLPFTSFPLVAKLTRSQMVAPLSLLPMAAMLALWLLPYLLRRGAMPPQAKLLMGFVMVALIACLAAFFLPIPPYKNQSVLSREVEALATLGVGLGFYLVIAGWAGRSDKLCFLMRWINWSGVLMLGYALFQAAVWYRLGHYPEWLWNFQGQVSTSLLLYDRRSNGFAYEPSWLAHQLNMLYLPLWLASTVTGFTAHRFRLWKIHFEHLLLLGGLAALILSVSRVGWLAFLLMAGYLMLLLTLRLLRWLQRFLLQRSAASERWSGLIHRWFVAAGLAVMLVIFAGLMLGAGYVLSHFDPRMAKLFDFTALKQGSILAYANQLVFAERIVFWQAGWGVFNDFPLLGVGLGNAGFFFPQKLSAFSWALTEVRMLIYQWTSLPNIKSLWVRLLAETGIIGFSLFVSWWYVLWKSGRFLLAHKDRLLQTIGMAGSFVLIGFIIEGFSVDTFALPYFWVSFGLLSAACELARRAIAGSGRFEGGMNE